MTLAQLNIHKQKLQLLGQQKRYEEAEKLSIEILTYHPNEANVWFALGQIRTALNKPAPALEAYARCVQLPSGHRNRALKAICDLTHRLGLYKDGFKAANAWLQQDNNNPEALFRCGDFLWKLKRVSEAKAAFRKIIELNPENTKLKIATASAMALTGDFDAFYRLLDGINATANQHLIAASRAMYSNYPDSFSNDDVFAMHQAFGNQLEADIEETGSRNVEPLADRKIRIGYLSPDLWRHSVAYFLLPILEAHDRERFEIFCYADGSRNDEVTEILQGLSDHWRTTADKSNAELHGLIIEDKIDVLFDLAALTHEGRRMEVFARRSAPIQINYLGYPNTSGLTRMDYRIVDTHTDPESQSQALHTEKLLYPAPSFLCFSPTEDTPGVAPLPALTNGHVTFGAFNAFLKITPKMLRIWADILNEITNSELIIKSEVLLDPLTRKQIATTFEQNGVDPGRVSLEGSTAGRFEHLNYYNRVDIHLDTFPYNGTTTTLEAAWMGVPTITLCGTNHRSRVGNSILRNLGLGQFIAESAQDYVNVAKAQTMQPDALASLRESLREQVKSSAIMDKESFVSALEESLESLVRASQIEH